MRSDQLAPHSSHLGDSHQNTSKQPTIVYCITLWWVYHSGDEMSDAVLRFRNRPWTLQIGLAIPPLLLHCSLSPLSVSLSLSLYISPRGAAVWCLDPSVPLLVSANVECKVTESCRSVTQSPSRSCLVRHVRTAQTCHTCRMSFTRNHHI